jgi:lysophospholipase L1-like esterase
MSLTLPGLTASRIVVTDSDLKLVSGTNTDTQISAAVTASHTALTLGTANGLSLATGQVLSLPTTATPEFAGLRINTSTTADRFVIADGGGYLVQARFNVDTYSTYDQAQSVCAFRKSNSMTIGTLAATTSGQALGAIGAYGVDISNAAFRYSGGLRFFQDGVAGADRVPVRIEFETSPGGTTVPVTRMTVGSTGNIAIPGTLNSLDFRRIHVVKAMGDSLTYAGTYEAQLLSLLGSLWTVTNNGIGGNTTTQMLARFSADCLTGGAEYIVIWGGVNDVLTGVAAATIESNLQAMYTAAQASGKTVVSINISPCKNFATWDAGKQTVLDAVNTWIAGTATGIDYKIDAYTLLEDPGAADTLLAAYDSGDHLHLTATGYNLVGTTVYNGVTWTDLFGVYLKVSNNVVLDQDVQRLSSPAFQQLTLAQGIIMQDTFGIRTATLDGADTAKLTFTAGGALSDSTRGSYISLYGNEHAGVGSIIAQLGDNASAYFKVRTGAATLGIHMLNTGLVGFGISPLEQVHSSAKVRADTAFNLNGTDGVTQAASAGTVVDSTSVAGGIVTGRTQITYIADGAHSLVGITSITTANGRITAMA